MIDSYWLMIVSIINLVVLSRHSNVDMYHICVSPCFSSLLDFPIKHVDISWIKSTAFDILRQTLDSDRPSRSSV